MSRFLFGDDLGNIKGLRYQQDATIQEEKAKIKTLLPAAGGDARRVAIQKIAVCPGTNTGNSLVCSPLLILACIEIQQVKLATASSDGALGLHSLSPADELETVCGWSEARLKDNQFVGLSVTST